MHKSLSLLAFILCSGVLVHDVSGLTRNLVKSRKAASSSSGSNLNTILSVLSKEEKRMARELQKSYGNSKGDREVLQMAFEFLKPNTREHALGTATILAEMKLDVASVVAGLLQCSVCQDDGERLQELEALFGPEILALVQGVAEIDSTLLSYGHREERPDKERETENYRKLILALARDIRVVLIKLADQIQRVRMLSSCGKEEQKRVARETLDLYAPLAHRLGMYTLKTELEDSSLRYWKPESFQQLQVMVSARAAQRQQYTETVISVLQKELKEGGLTVNPQVTGRAKSFYSIYQKMQKKNVAFDDIQDIMAFRILVDDLSQCYQALGIVHSHWKPVKGRFKDYVALPKPNGYQSLHTTVIGPESKRMEVQIRTHDMHRIAEGGVAAHWMYKDKTSSATATNEEAQRYKFLRQLVEWAQHKDDDYPDDEASDSNEPAVEKEVFVFSPAGQLFALTQGATVLDFAYRVHSQVGDRCVGAKVNGKMVPLKYTVQNGDTVEILQSTNQKPKQEWLNMVQTTKAKARIKSRLKKEQVGQDSLALGKDMLEKGLRKRESSHPHLDGMAEYQKKLPNILSLFKLNNEQHLLTALAYGQVSVPSVLQEVFAGPPPTDRAGQDEDEVVLGSVQEDSSALSNTPDGLVVGGKRNILVSFCRNCNALYGEAVQGVVTQGRGVKVHRLDCRYLLESDPARRVDAVWDEAAKATKRALVVEVLFEDAPGMLAGMSKAISSAGVNMGGVVSKTLSNGQGLARFELILTAIEDLHRVTTQLQQVKGVLNVNRR